MVVAFSHLHSFFIAIKLHFFSSAVQSLSLLPVGRALDANGTVLEFALLLRSTVHATAEPCSTRRSSCIHTATCCSPKAYGFPMNGTTAAVLEIDADMTKAAKN